MVGGGQSLESEPIGDYSEGFGAVKLGPVCSHLQYYYNTNLRVICLANWHKIQNMVVTMIRRCAPTPESIPAHDESTTQS